MDLAYFTSQWDESHGFAEAADSNDCIELRTMSPCRTRPSSGTATRRKYLSLRNFPLLIIRQTALRLEGSLIQITQFFNVSVQFHADSDSCVAGLIVLSVSIDTTIKLVVFRGLLRLY